MKRIYGRAVLCLLCSLQLVSLTTAAVPVDTSKYHASCGVAIRQVAEQLEVTWSIDDRHDGRLILNLGATGPLITTLGIAERGSDVTLEVVEQVDPVFWVTEGTRQMPPGKPADQLWQVFFDNPHQRAHHTARSELQLQSAIVRSHGRRAVIRVTELTLGSFRGALEFTFYAATPLWRIDAVAATDEPARAYIYDAGLIAADQPSWSAIHWIDTEGQQQVQHGPAMLQAGDTPLAVRHRMLGVEGAHGFLCCFSLPHQFQFPRDYSDNLQFVWHGRDHGGSQTNCGFGIRQNKDGGGAFVPWFNAPPGSEQRMGVFFLLSAGERDKAFEQVLAFTHEDRFRELPGYVTMTSHWHMAIAVAAMARQGADVANPATPDFVRMFHDMNVNIVHLAEFHGDGHQMDGGELRLAELSAMFNECRRWSDERLLLIPGEEVNTFLGLPSEGKHPGHWMSVFPKPVYWIMQREGDQPFATEHPQYGRVYRVGSRGDMVRLLREEAGLVWAAHPRIKASSWTPDIFRNEDFFIADFWLGGAWKAMPADLSHPRLGERVLDLLDDMANWGHKKYVLGEVDVFKIDHTHELYGHMNVNYVRLDRVPRFDEGWQNVLDALRDGQFFVTTGEVLIPEFTVASVRSGGNVSLRDHPQPELRAEITWTFPLAFAEIISGDGKEVFRERIDLSHTGSFGQDTLNVSPDLRGRRWVRLEVWDVAANGAFTQPVWLVKE